MQFKVSQIAKLEKRGGASVVFLGSSAVDAAVDAGAIRDPKDNRPAYNAGLGGGSIGMVATWARVEAIPRLKPRVVVIGLSSRELNPNNGRENNLDRNFFASPAVKHLVGTESVLEKTERHLESLSALFKYRTNLRQPRYLEALFGLGNAPRADDYARAERPSGQYTRFLNETYDFGPAVRGLYSNQALFHFTLGGKKLQQLNRLMTYLQQQRIRVILVNMPVTQDFVDLHPRGRADYDRVAAALRKEAQTSNATFADPGIWPREQFADPGHMNRFGSQRFTTYLQGHIDRLG
jgi:hypothetical protein